MTLASGLLVIGMMSTAPQLAAPLPAALDPGADRTLVTTLAAQGVQIYECRATPGAASAHAWTFVAPEAELLDVRGRRVGRHGAGPVWQAADGSRIVGQVQARADAPAAAAIPWLLLRTQPAAGAPQGDFSAVTHVQRINTAGGVAPDRPCTAEQVGQRERVPYRADYLLFSAR